MKRILLYEPNRQTPKHISLLLKVADLDCIVAEFMDEVLNWLTIDQLKDNHFDLILLNAWPDTEVSKKLFVELSTKLAIPVIYIQRKGEYQPSGHDQKVSICLPENVLSCIYSHLSNASSGTDTQKSKCCQIIKQMNSVKGEFKAPCSCQKVNKQGNDKSNNYTNKCHSRPSDSNNTTHERGLI